MSDLHLNPIIRRIAQNMIYATDLSHVSESCDKLRLEDVQRLQAKLAAVLDNRIDQLIAPLNDHDAMIALDAAQDLTVVLLRDRLEKIRAAKWARIWRYKRRAAGRAGIQHLL